MKDKILEAYNMRFACKAFEADKKISDEDFNFILETGRLSPSSFGYEPWKFLVVQKPELRAELKEYAWGAQGQLPTASHFVIILVRKPVDMKFGSKYIDHMMANVKQLPLEAQDLYRQFYKNFQLNDFDLTDDRKLIDWASKQTYIALGNMMTAAAMIGIDSCPIEGFDAKKVTELLTEKGLMDADHFVPAVMVAFGYRDESQDMFPKTRQSMEDIVIWS